jgi:hypothetical protein
MRVWPNGNFEISDVVAPKQLDARLEIAAPGHKPVRVLLAEASRVPYDLRVTLVADTAGGTSEVWHQLRPVQP